MQAAKELRLFSAARHFRERMLTERRTANRESRRMDRRELLTQSGLSVLGAIIAGASLLWALTAAFGGRLTPGDVTQLVGAIGAVQSGVATLVSQLMRSHQELTMFDHYLAVVDSGPDLPVPELAAKAPPACGSATPEHP